MKNKTKKNNRRGRDFKYIKKNKNKNPVHNDSDDDDRWPSSSVIIIIIITVGYKINFTHELKSVKLDPSIHPVDDDDDDDVFSQFNEEKKDNNSLRIILGGFG